jgi:RHS repeat-associated protein
MFHHFPEELKTKDYLVRSTEFTYRETPVASFITGVIQSGFVRQDNGTYLKQSLPPVEFEYTQAQVQTDVQDVGPESLANLPASVDGTAYQWLDLDGEGLQCVLAEQDDNWYYKRNLSPLTFDFVDGQPIATAQFEPLTEVSRLPSFAESPALRPQFLDLAGDGQLDCVVLDRPVPGFFKRTEDEDWEPFQPLDSVPVVDWSEPNLRFIDLDGDGHADILITENEVLTWYPSLAEAGFGAPIRVSKPIDEEQGPAIVFADATHSIFLADMSGDGLTDIVRVRNGEVCYWPNLGFGRFGPKVSMDMAPWFDTPDQFEPRRVRLADIDGSGTTDLFYIGRDGVRLYFNRSGNSWSEPQSLPAFPRVDDLSTVQALDLLGNGTACLVWTSSLPGDAARSMRYIDLMGGEKPHLLVRSRNNLGAETRVYYATSTKFYLADRQAGRPWVTRLPFPVHVVERVEMYDWLSRNRFVTRYTYHHGYYDGFEREFRGFGMVEQLDTEELGALTQAGAFPDAVNIDAASYVPPVLTKTWFHTGVYPQSDQVSRHLEDEYYRESDQTEGIAGLTDAEFEAMLLPDTVLPDDLTADEVREACRSLKGAILRQEVYALDGTDEADRPYSVSERNYTINRVQPFGGNRHAVFFTHARETIDFHYERKLFPVLNGKIVDEATAAGDPNVRWLADPRVTHTMILAVDPYGNELLSVAIGYGRRFDDGDPILTEEDRAKQKRIHLTCTESTYTDPILEPDAYRPPLPAETRTFELINVTPDRKTPDITNLFDFDELANTDSKNPGKVVQASDGQHDLNYEDINAAGATTSDPWRRPIEHVRTLYRKDDLSALLPLGHLESLALPFQSYKLAFTPGLLAQVFTRTLGAASPENLLPDPAGVLGGKGADQGGYVDLDFDGRWWIPSGRVFFSAGAADTPSQELAIARAHFFLPRKFSDPFDQASTIDYDVHDLAVVKTEDAIQNTVMAILDYRVLQPKVMTDPNGNQSLVAFDALGLVTGTVVMGKSGEGDSLEDFAPDLTAQQVDDFLAAADPHGPALDLLGSATTRVVYDMDRFRDTRDANPDAPTQWQPAFAATIVRETHVSDLVPGQTAKLQVSFSYSDGFGRVIQKKIQAEPGPVPPGDAVVNPRWVGSGWTIFNNKGKPVRQYEPFFSATHAFEYASIVGVSPILFYDPVERVVATLHPNHAWEKVVFDPWRQTSYDVNDTVTFDPKGDPDASAFFARLPDADFLPTWYDQRMAGAMGAAEQEAATKTAAHANTPAVAFADSLGRTFLAIADNGPFGKYATRIELDIEGNQRAVIDAKGRIVMLFDYDMLGTKVHQSSMEAGQRWMLNDVAGKPIRAWDSRGHAFRTEYDLLRRPIHSFVQGAAGSEADPRTVGKEILFARTQYGEGQPGDVALNLRTRVMRQDDGAGTVAMGPYDFKGNLLQSSRQLAQEYKNLADWSGQPVLESEIFRSTTSYDALNRVLTATLPDDSITRPTYNEANFLERLDVNLRGEQDGNGQPDWTPFVTNIDYDAKGQRELIDYGNGAQTNYAYDSLNFRLTRLLTTRPANLNGLATSLFKSATTVQDLNYTYDPAGNITRIADDALPVIFYNNQQVDPVGRYTYDAVYRLIEAQGREHIGQTALQLGVPQPTYRDYPFVGLGAQPFDPQAVRTYTEQYVYDEVGNFQSLVHQAENGSWQRDYRYLEPSLTEPQKFFSNRLSDTVLHPNGNQPITEPYAHDAHGNMTAMPHLSSMRWDCMDRLIATSRQVVNPTSLDGVVPETTNYVYDAAGQRMRKVTENQSGVRRTERIYLGGFEVYREYNGSGSVIKLERQTLHVMDDRQRIALVETRTLGTELSPVQLTCYQLGNHLGSASLELDHTGELISYEEYYPYGASAYQSGRNKSEISLKRYRYTGKERDEETGLYYHGARYFAAWLGRWTSCDPPTPTPGTNLYHYVHGKPTRSIDSDGRYDSEFFKTDDLKTQNQRRADAVGLLFPEFALWRGMLALVTGQVSTDYLLPGIGTAAVVADEAPRLGYKTHETVDHVLKGEGRAAVNSGIDALTHAQNLGFSLLPFLTDIASRPTSPSSTAPEPPKPPEPPKLADPAETPKLAESPETPKAADPAETPKAADSPEPPKPPDADSNGAPSVAAQKASAPVPSSGGTSTAGTLVGENTAQMRRVAARKIADTPGHPLKFLLDDKGHFKATRGLKHSELANRADLVQMGHITSDKVGGPERIMLQGAWENQFNNVTVEHSSKGGCYIENVAIDIGGIAVDLETAKMWVKENLIPESLVQNAKRITP